MRIIAVINQKGGVGKTTTTANLSHALALQGKRILMLDMDPQAHLSASFGFQGVGISGMDEVMFGRRPLGDVVMSIRPGLDLVPAGDKLAEFEFKKEGGSQRGFVLKSALENLSQKYDLIMLDCPPSTGLTGMNCILASNEQMIPVASDFLAMHGLTRLLGIIETIEERLQKQSKRWVVVTRYYDRRLLAREIRNKLAEMFPNEMLSTPIRENVALAEAPGHGQTVFDYRKNSNGAKDYMQLAEDLLNEKTAAQEVKANITELTV